MIFLIILIIIVSVIGIADIVYGVKENPDAAAAASVGIFCLMVSFVLIMTLISAKTTEPKPKAIDVYNNKTRLQIIYQDTIPIDTVVVFKEEFKPNFKF